MTRFTTARCTVRSMTEGDLPALFAVYGDPETVRYVGDRVPLSPEQCVRWLEVTTANYAARGYGMFAIVARPEDEAIGFCGIVHPGGQPTPEIKYAFRRDTWGRRLASEIVPALLDHGFGALGLERIIATVHPENTPSVRVLESSGMRLEGIATHEDGERTATYARERRPSSPAHSHALPALALAWALMSAASGCGGDTTPKAPPHAATPAPVAAALKDSLVHVATPAPGDTVSSPLALRGEARGTWFFEASFPVRLLDADGRELTVTYATAGGEWMTTEFVPFSSTVTFASPAAGSAGTLVLAKDNPSGEPEFDDERRIPIVFRGP